jgi:hypothetical protein
VAPAIVGFCKFEVKVFGPVQLYELAPPGLAVKFRLDPAQSVELLPAVGAAGVGLTLTEIVEFDPPQPDTFIEQL